MEKELVKVLKALADENRIRILKVISDKKICVCFIEKTLKMTQSNVSRHLTKLKDAGLIVCEKQGQFAYYSMNSSALKKFPFLPSLISSLGPSNARNGKKSPC